MCVLGVNGDIGAKKDKKERKADKTAAKEAKVEAAKASKAEAASGKKAQ